MYRKDPITGAAVPTPAGFWALEAEREGEGRSGAELAEEFWVDFHTEQERWQRQEEARLRKEAMALFWEKLEEERRLQPARLEFLRDAWGSLLWALSRKWAWGSSGYWFRVAAQALWEWLRYQPVPHGPLAILGELQASAWEGWKAGGWRLSGVVQCEEGTFRLSAGESHYEGSFYEPPSSEATCAWTRVRLDHKTGRWLPEQVNPDGEA